MKANPCLPFSGSYSCHPALSSLYNTLDILLPSFPLHANALYDDEDDDDDDDDDVGDGDGEDDKDGSDDRFDMIEDTTQHSRTFRSCLCAAACRFKFFSPKPLLFCCSDF